MSIYHRNLNYLQELICLLDSEEKAVELAELTGDTEGRQLALNRYEKVQTELEYVCDVMQI